MANFTYKARDSSGKLIAGIFEAESKLKVYEFLSNKKLIPIEIKSHIINLSLTKTLDFLKKPKTKDLISFIRQFRSLFKAGVNMNKIFTVLINQIKNPVLNNALQIIRDDVQKGSTLADAFSKHPQIFNKIFTSMIAIGEEAGILDKTLLELETLFEKDYRVTKKVKSATLYPKIVIFVLIAVIIVALTYIIPVFQDFYAGYGKRLPTPTLILLMMSNIFRSFWYIFTVIIIGSIFGYKRYKATKRGRFEIDKLKYKLPIFGNLFMQVDNSRFSRLLSALYQSGLPIVKSLEIVSTSIGNTVYESEIHDIKDKIVKGSSLAAAMEKQQHFTPIIIEATVVGEESGNLDNMLNSVATFYDEEVNYSLENLTTTLEPILLFFIFGFIGFLAFAIYMPIINLSSTVLPK